MKNRIMFALAGLSLVGFLIAPSMAGPLAGHSHLQAARRSINKALQDCRNARADEHNGEFGGHRDKAEQLLQEAKGELDAAAEYANSHR